MRVGAWIAPVAWPIDTGKTTRTILMRISTATSRGRTRAPYPLEYRRKIVELARAGRMPELAAEFGVSSQSIRIWIKRDAIDGGERNDGLTSNELAELRRLRRENKQLRLEREILSKAAADSIDHRNMSLSLSAGVA